MTLDRISSLEKMLMDILPEEVSPDILSLRSKLLFPSPQFFPGVLTSSLPIALSAILHRSPNEIVPFFLEQLSEQEDVKVESAQGYLNFALRWLPVSMDISSKFTDGPIHIVVAPRSSFLSVFAHLRMLSRALLQFLLCCRQNIPASLKVGTYTYTSALNEGDIRDLYLQEIGASPLLSQEIESYLAPESEKATVFWLSPMTLPKDRFRAWYSPVRNREALFPKMNGALLCCPSAGWLHGNEPSSGLLKQSFQSEHICSLIYLLASPIPTWQLDIRAAFFQERANIPWYFVRTVERLESRLSQMAKRSSLPLKEYDLSDLSAKGGEWVARIGSEGALLQARIEIAAWYGEVDAMIEGLERLAQGLNRTLNYPRSLAAFSVSEHISPSLFSTISDNMERLCLLP